MATGGAYILSKHRKEYCEIEYGGDPHSKKCLEHKGDVALGIMIALSAIFAFGVFIIIRGMIREILTWRKPRWPP